MLTGKRAIQTGLAFLNNILSIKLRYHAERRVWSYGMIMDGWYVQVKGYEGDDARSILLCGRGYRQHPQLGEQNVGWSSR